MKRNVTIQTKEERTLEAMWVLKCFKDDHLTYTKKFDEMPSDNEIAQFIHDTKSDYVKLEHIFRLCDCDIPSN